MSEKIINNGSSRRNNKEQPLPAKSVIPRNQRCRHFLFSLFHNVSSHLLSRAHRLISPRRDLVLELGKVVLVAQFCCENNLGLSPSHLPRLINTHTLTQTPPHICALSKSKYVQHIQVRVCVTKKRGRRPSCWYVKSSQVGAPLEPGPASK